jgi:hypothetical protein
VSSVPLSLQSFTPKITFLNTTPITPNHHLISTIYFLAFVFGIGTQYGNEIQAETSKLGDDNGAVTERTPFLWSGRNQVEVSKRAHVIKALLYAVQNFYAFMLM